ncbi:hypothetical protein Bca52824_003350 [Brassica carinata]|uniref:Prephenate/arogenate dehydrogenase domain-containing protein n=1 Tax=Brassica carinata TaxID=52824 RepID=A0A8X8BEP2_BRACI|nr:hypothetical protein Bca52824_003350 [Brassica carinata]
MEALRKPPPISPRFINGRGSQSEKPISSSSSSSSPESSSLSFSNDISFASPLTTLSSLQHSSTNLFSLSFPLLSFSPFLLYLHVLFLLSSPPSQSHHHFSSPLSIPIHLPHSLRIAIVGFGNYGQFLAETLASQGHTLLAHSRSDHSAAATRLGVSFFTTDLHDLCERHPDVVLLCTSILSTESVLKTLPFQRLRRNTLFVDVLSVKDFAKTLLLQYVPDDFDILCTHPMFGPQSASSNHGSWRGLRFVYDKVRIGETGRESRGARVF